jgi:hypothetical protein
MVFNATFNNISVLLVEETGVPGENHQPQTNKYWVLSTPRRECLLDVFFNSMIKLWLVILRIITLQ